MNHCYTGSIIFDSMHVSMIPRIAATNLFMFVMPDFDTYWKTMHSCTHIEQFSSIYSEVLHSDHVLDSETLSRKRKKRIKRHGSSIAEPT